MRTLSVTVFILWLGSTSIIPMLPVYIRHLGGTVTLAGLVMASFFAAGVLTQYPVGKLADRVGCKPVLLAGIATYALACFGFLFPIVPAFAIVLRGMQGLGAGAAAVASLAMISGTVAAERRGRAFASVISAEVAGMAVGPLIGATIGYHFMWFMFLGSGIIALGAGVPAMRLVEHREPVAEHVAQPETGTDSVSESDASADTPADGHPEIEPAPLAKLQWSRSMIGALVAGAALGLITGIYDICWTLLMLSRGATGWQIGISWTLFCIPFVVAARPGGWLADHMDRRFLVLGGLGLAALFCASYPFIHWIPLLMVLSSVESLGFAVAMPALQSLLIQGSDPAEVGRIQGMFGTIQTAMMAVSAAAAGAAFALAVWVPFVSAAILTLVALSVTAVAWRTVVGHVQPEFTKVDVSFDPASGEAQGADPVANDAQAAVGVNVEVQ